MILPQFWSIKLFSILYRLLAPWSFVLLLYQYPYTEVQPGERTPVSPVMAVFREIAFLLDDLYEVVVKHLRDTTIESVSCFWWACVKLSSVINCHFICFLEFNGSHFSWFVPGIALGPCACTWVTELKQKESSKSVTLKIKLSKIESSQKSDIHHNQIRPLPHHVYRVSYTFEKSTSYRFLLNLGKSTVNNNWSFGDSNFSFSTCWQKPHGPFLNRFLSDRTPCRAADAKYYRGRA